MKKVALVTGSAKRLGRDIALGLSRLGYSIAIQYLKSSDDASLLKAHILENQCDAEIFACDIKNAKNVSRLIDSIIERFGQLDLLINNIGVYQPKNIANVSVEEWDETIQTNLNGSFYASHFALPHLEKTKGNIINIGYSGTENILPNVNATAYAISKSGLLILTKSLAKQFGPKGIRVNMVSPGQLEYSIDLPKNLKDVIPLQRPGTSEDIVNTIRHLLENQYTTGINIDVAGGYML